MHLIIIQLCDSLSHSVRGSGTAQVRTTFHFGRKRGHSVTLPPLSRSDGSFPAEPTTRLQLIPVCAWSGHADALSRSTTEPRRRAALQTCPVRFLPQTRPDEFAWRPCREAGRQGNAGAGALGSSPTGARPRPRPRCHRPQDLGSPPCPPPGGGDGARPACGPRRCPASARVMSAA